MIELRDIVLFASGFIVGALLLLAYQTRRR
jgi:hypothetical protein